MPRLLELFIEYGNFLFAFIFNVETILKIMALGVSYFYESWNKFDFIIVIGTDIGILISAIGS